LDSDIPGVTGVAETRTQVFLRHWIFPGGKYVLLQLVEMILDNREELEKSKRVVVTEIQT